MTPSARARIDCGIVRPSAPAIPLTPSARSRRSLITFWIRGISAAAATVTVLSALAEINPGDPVWREELSLMRQMLSGKQANTPDTSA
jgi:hypothetical protein